jgi:hypothetical protein
LAALLCGCTPPEKREYGTPPTDAAADGSAAAAPGGRDAAVTPSSNADAAFRADVGSNRLDAAAVRDSGSKPVDASADTGTMPTPPDAAGPAPVECDTADDCPELALEPAECAVAECQAGTCRYVAVDADEDGFSIKVCAATDTPVEVVIGSDCDDTNRNVNPDAWDGPEDADHKDGCDGKIDNDCSSRPDDGVLADGTTCVCSPGDKLPCSQTSNGVEITYPRLDASGLPYGNCSLGEQTCGNDGSWGFCKGAIGPEAEVCDQVDNDCNAVADDNPSDTQTFWYDADGDFHAAPWAVAVVACAAPPTAPSECSKHQATCPARGWITTAIPADDCDDTTATRYRGAPEICNGIDDDCSNTDESDAEPEEDADGDEFTSEDYAGCSGGFPRTDCFDSNSDVHPGQTKRFNVGYCLQGNTPYWCFTEGQCASKEDCIMGSIGQTWGPGSVDYNCDGIEEPFSVVGTDTVPYAAACQAVTASDCVSSTAPTYATSANAACGMVDQHQQCKPATAGGCAYKSTFLQTACR